jgi:hypothetical protein
MKVEITSCHEKYVIGVKNAPDSVQVSGGRSSRITPYEVNVVRRRNGDIEVYVIGSQVRADGSYAKRSAHRSHCWGWYGGPGLDELPDWVRDVIRYSGFSDLL